MRSQQNAKILILTASFGSGHITASEALKAAFNSRGYGTVGIVDFFNATMPRLNKLVKSLYMGTLKRAPRLYGTFYDRINRLEQDSWLQNKFDRLGYDKLLECLKSTNPEIVICTYPTPSGVVANIREKGVYDCFLVTVITDFEAHSQWINPGVDLYIVAHEGLVAQLTGEGIAREKIAVTGIPIATEFSHDLKIDKESLGLETQLPLVLIMSGGSGMEKIACEALNACMNLPYDVQAVMVCGNDAKLEKELGEKFAADRKIKILGFVNNISELMSAADVLVTKPGGVTVSEALAKRLPIILYRPIPGQEEANARFAVNSGAGFLATDPGELEEYLNKALDKTTSSQLKKAAQSIAKPDAARVAARQIIKRFLD